MKQYHSSKQFPKRIALTKATKQREKSFIVTYKYDILINLVVAIIFCIIGFLTGINRKDIENVVNRRVSILEQKMLTNEEYKKYIDIYNEIYGNTLKQLFPYGYTLIGARKGSVLFFDNYTNNQEAEFRIVGHINFTAKGDIKITMGVQYLAFLKDKFIIEGSTFEKNISDYRIGHIYSNHILNSSKIYSIIILNDDRINPVYVIGFS